MQCACTILSSMACPGLQYFSTSSHKRHYFRGKKKLLNVRCVFSFSLQFLSQTFLILRRTERHRSKMYNSLHVKCTLFLSDFNETWIFIADFWKCSIIKFHETPSSGNRVFPWGQTDTIKLTVAFRNFANAPTAPRFQDSRVHKGDRVVSPAHQPP